MSVFDRPAKCANCGHEFKEGEQSVVVIDPKTDWWETVFDSKQYCDECIKKRSEVVK